MTLLHDLLNTRNQQGFQRLLDIGYERGQSSNVANSSNSGGKSWSRRGTLGPALSIDVNGRDWLGRAALHIACTSLENIEFVRALLKHPGINVNIQDKENHWTPLHRALYNANFPAALLLLQRSDIDTSLKDLEGYTAFDLYNSTVNETKPSIEQLTGQLFTWGANRNAALGFGDGGDRTFPDQVTIPKKEDIIEVGKQSVAARFAPIQIRQVKMSKLHTGVVTSESGGNLLICGFGSGGRLGPGQHMQYSLKSLPQFSHKVVSIALGQDHTLVLLDTGEVFSWGLNRFSQLGYVVELSTTGRSEEPIQYTPKKIPSLKKEVVRGVAASKTVSACWTREKLFTWGTNGGQLGYDKTTQPVQILPRVVTKVSSPVVDVSLSDSVMACLLITKQVECVWNDRVYRVNFPTAFPSEIQPYRPPQATKDAHISKITSCDETFAALSSNGEVFIFQVPSVSDVDTNSGKAGPTFKPQRVWALRKKFSAVKDVALGSDGSIIICTESGHVFVRTRNSKSGQNVSGKMFKFQRIPYIQRITQVCANSTGAFGALRMDYQPNRIAIHGNLIAQDLSSMQPYVRMYGSIEGCVPDVLSGVFGLPGDKNYQDINKALLEDDDDFDDYGITKDIQSVRELCLVIVNERDARRMKSSDAPLDKMPLPLGADSFIQVQSGAEIPVHRVILSARSDLICSVFLGGSVQDPESGMSMRLLRTTPVPGAKKIPRLSISGCQPMAVLILLHYLYSDSVLAIWDRRISMALEEMFKFLKINPSQVKADLQALARFLDLPILITVLEPVVKRIPAPSMSKDLTRLFRESQGHSHFTLDSSPLTPDVILQLIDTDVYCHSIILRSRSEFFANFFLDGEWTHKRWDAYGMIRINMKHLDSHTMEYILRYMCCGEDMEMFDFLDFAKSVDDVIEFMFDVLSAANELLLDRLVLLCSHVILTFLNVQNACYILADATHFNAEQLVERLQSYITVNMEIFLESGMLDDLPYQLVKQLAKFAQNKQKEKSPISRSNHLVNLALERQAEWLSQQDIPEPIVRSLKDVLRRDVKSSPPASSKKPVRFTTSDSPLSSPKVLPQKTIRRPPSGDDIFVMDDNEVVSLQMEPPTNQLHMPTIPSVAKPTTWKASSVPRVDMKTLMAEEAAGIPPQPGPHNNKTRPVEIKRTMLGTPTESSGPDQTLRSSTSWTDQPNRLKGTQVSGSSTVSVATASTSSLRADKSPVLSMTPRPPPPSPSLNPNLGPVITPTKQSSSKSNLITSPQGVRNISGGKAWTLPPVQAVSATSPSPSRSGLSFIAIQHAQLEQDVKPVREKRSLLEIQEEERSRQEEEDFLKWWTAEEARVKEETELLARFQAEHTQAKTPKAGNRKFGGKSDSKAGGGKRRTQTTVEEQSSRRGEPSGAGGDAPQNIQDSTNRPNVSKPALHKNVKKSNPTK